MGGVKLRVLIKVVMWPHITRHERLLLVDLIIFTTIITILVRMYDINVSLNDVFAQCNEATQSNPGSPKMLTENVQV